LAKAIIADLPRWSDLGWSGYLNFFSGQVEFVGQIPINNATLAKATHDPFFATVNSIPDVTYEISTYTVFPRFKGYWNFQAVDYSTYVPGDFITGGWLVPRSSFEGAANIQAYANTLQYLVANTPYAIIQMIGGGAVNSVPVDFDALGPAWRQALVQTIFGLILPEGSNAATRAQYEQRASNYTQLIRNLAPASGAYFNEAEVLQPNWQQAVWGDHYERLLETKQLYDPDNTFVCWHCVGSEKYDRYGNCYDDDE